MSTKTITNEDTSNRLSDLDLAEEVHSTLEHLTPPEALAILRMVAANLKAEIRTMEDDLIRRVNSR